MGFGIKILQCSCGGLTGAWFEGEVALLEGWSKPMHRGFTPLELVMSLSVVSALAAALLGAGAHPQREPAGSSKPARIIAAVEGR